MKLDAVHDLQQVFRKIVRALSFPGEIQDVSEFAEKIDLDVSFNKTALLAALTLLDAETTFYVDGKGASETAAVIAQLTYAKQVENAAADFVFLLGAAANAAGVWSAARPGTLIDPHQGATLVLEVGELQDEGALLLSGPGIETARSFGTGGDSFWVEARAEKNKEFPLGVDVVFVDKRARIACLPRTTLVEKGE
jgi:alpha-D-ribose 1-methylphosphonate 5-triphosphate synthase subunit PhnH